MSTDLVSVKSTRTPGQIWAIIQAFGFTGKKIQWFKLIKGTWQQIPNDCKSDKLGIFVDFDELPTKYKWVDNLGNSAVFTLNLNIIANHL